MALYPSELEAVQVFKDNTRVLFRPARATDERAVKEFFYALPKEESYMRFLSTMKVFPHYDVQRMVNIDYHHVMTIVGVVGELETERIVAVAQYVLNEEEMTAEIDFAVRPDYGRKGIASFLLHHLVSIAKARCIRMLKAYIAPGNERVFGVFQKLGYVVESSRVEGIHEIRLHTGQLADVCLMEPSD